MRSGGQRLAKTHRFDSDKVNEGSSPSTETFYYASVVELVYTLVLGTSAERIEGSSPSGGT